MGRTKLLQGSAALVLLTLANACAPTGSDSDESPSSVDSSIFGGSTDTTHAAVAALIQNTATGLFGCTGTTIARKGQSGVLLTAAHCVVEFDESAVVPVLPPRVVDPANLLVVPGNDWLSAGLAGDLYEVLSATLHPDYDGEVASPYDIAVVQYAGATPSTSIIPILSAADDDLEVGSDLTVLGYGVTPTDSENSKRFSVGVAVADLTDLQLVIDQTNGKGVCRGDSGGPWLYQTSDSAHVAGVSSFSDDQCEEGGVAVRVSPHTAFIEGAIDDLPTELECGACQAAASAPGNVCRAANVACATEDSACVTFVTCASECTTNACTTNCIAENEQGFEDYSDYVSCVCKDGCASECSDVEACQSFNSSCGGFTASNAACDQCISGTCCTEAADCSNDAGCLACTSNSALASCATNPAFNAFTGCLSSCDANPCGVPTSGTGGAGAGGNAGTAGTGEGGANDAGSGDGTTTGGVSASGGTNAHGGGGPIPPMGRAGSGGSSGAETEPGEDTAGTTSSTGGDASNEPESGAGTGAKGDTGDGGTDDDDDGDTDGASKEPRETGCACTVPARNSGRPELAGFAAVAAGLVLFRRKSRMARTLG